MGLVYPDKCVLCGRTLPVLAEEKTFLCPSCAEQLEREYRYSAPLMIPNTDDAAAALKYRGAVADAMRAFKFRQKQSYADWFAAQLVPLLEDKMNCWKPDCVTFAPISFWRMHTRGYNQAELLAKRIAEAVSLPCINTLRKRPFVGKQSKRKNAEARWQNVANAFLPRLVDLTGLSVLFVDDIITTGATVSAACGVLRAMGAAHIYALAPTRTVR